MKTLLFIILSVLTLTIHGQQTEIINSLPPELDSGLVGYYYPGVNIVGDKHVYYSEPQAGLKLDTLYSSGELIFIFKAVDYLNLWYIDLDDVQGENYKNIYKSLLADMKLAKTKKLTLFKDLDFRENISRHLLMDLFRKKKIYVLKMIGGKYQMITYKCRYPGNACFIVEKGQKYPFYSQKIKGGYR